MFSITMTVNAWGEVTVNGTMQAGGGPFEIAYAKPQPEKLAGVSCLQACTRVSNEIQLNAHAQYYQDFMNDIRLVARHLVSCLPDPNDFDDDGRPL